VFFPYLVASIQRQRPSFGKQKLDKFLAAVTPAAVPNLAEALVVELSEGECEPLLIVIEDLHLVCDSEWVVPFFRRLLPLLPTEIHMLITSRTMVPAPLWRMRSKQMLVVIDEETLAFTRVEAVELFRSFGLTNEQASIAFDHTRGRAGVLASFAAGLSESNRTRIS
jgi:LuxR family maltose regulon positive regulatory protein